MKNFYSWSFRCAIIAASISAAAPMWAADMPPATMERPLLGPWVPKAVRDQVTVPAEQTRDQALRDQVERKLRAGFDAAAARHGGSLTAEQARAAGLGFVAGNFEAIDARKKGTVRFDDVRQFLRARGAQLN